MLHFIQTILKTGVKIAHSVQRLGYGLHDRRIWLRLLTRETPFFLLRNVQAVPGTYPAPYIMITGGWICDKGAELTTHLHLVSRLRIVELNPPICLYDVVLN